jgi:uncharacterized membrane protein YhhN
VIWILLTAIATGALVAADRSGSAPAMRLFKPLASAGFVGLACSQRPLDNPYGTAVLVALALSFVGDLCLLSARARWFLAGLVAFALAHVAYIVAFAQLAPSATTVLVLAAVLGVPALFVHRWLHPHVEPAMRLPVQAYILIITTMVAFAAAAVLVGGPPGALIGAALFYASDLAVARDRFVAPAFANRAWGLPTYYAAQLVLASTVG